MRLATKVLSLLFLAGSSTAVYLLVPKFSNNDISGSNIEVEDKSELSKERTIPAGQQELTKEGYTLVSKNDSGQLFPGLSEAYREEKNISLGEADKELSELCDKFRAQEQLSEEEQKEAKRGCVQPRTLESVFQHKGKKFLYKKENNGYFGNNAETAKKAREYSQNKEDKGKMEADGKDHSLLTINSGDSPQEIEKFQNACLNLLGIRNFEKGFEESVEKAERGCLE